MKDHDEQTDEGQEAPSVTDLQIETLSGDLRDGVLAKVRMMNRGWSTLTEEEQRELAAGLEMTCKDLVRNTVRLLTGWEWPRAVVNLGEIKIVGGDKARIEGKITAHNVEVNRNVLGDHVNSQVMLLCVDSETFMGEKEPAKIDPDQPGLPIDQENAAASLEPIPSSMLRNARDAILKENVVSTSFIQRRLAIGYNKAARIIEALEEEGFISKPDETGKRRIIDRDEGEDES